MRVLLAPSVANTGVNGAYLRIRLYSQIKNPIIPKVYPFQHLPPYGQNPKLVSMLMYIDQL